MQVFKYIILFLIFMGSSYIGILISRKFKKRKEELKQIKTALNMLETKIKFTYEPLPEIFDQIAKSLPENVNKIFKISSIQMQEKSVSKSWEYAIDNTDLSINNEDKNILKELGNLLRTNRYRRTSKPNRDN